LHSEAVGVAEDSTATPGLGFFHPRHILVLATPLCACALLHPHCVLCLCKHPWQCKRPLGCRGSVCPPPYFACCVPFVLRHASDSQGSTRDRLQQGLHAATGSGHVLLGLALLSAAGSHRVGSCTERGGGWAVCCIKLLAWLPFSKSLSALAGVCNARACRLGQVWCVAACAVCGAAYASPTLARCWDAVGAHACAVFLVMPAFGGGAVASLFRRHLYHLGGRYALLHGWAGGCCKCKLLAPSLTDWQPRPPGRVRPCLVPCAILGQAKRFWSGGGAVGCCVLGGFSSHSF
jgi:hypothetical protein